MVAARICWCISSFVVLLQLLAGQMGMQRNCSWHTGTIHQEMVLEAFALTDGRGDAIDSIMNNRHLIAHGKSSDSRITLVQVQDFRLTTACASIFDNDNKTTVR